MIGFDDTLDDKLKKIFDSKIYPWLPLETRMKQHIDEILPADNLVVAKRNLFCIHVITDISEGKLLSVPASVHTPEDESPSSMMNDHQDPAESCDFVLKEADSKLRGDKSIVSKKPRQHKKALKPLPTPTGPSPDQGRQKAVEGDKGAKPPSRGAITRTPSPSVLAQAYPASLARS